LKQLQNISILIGVFVFCGILYGFSLNKQNKQRVVNVDVNISDDATLGFVDQALVENLLRHDGNYILGQSIDSIHVQEIEDLVNKNPFVSDAEAYVGIDGTFHISIEQRKPVMRVMGKDGASFYVDDRGVSMPISPIHVAKVIPCTGVKNIDRKFYFHSESIASNKDLLAAYNVAKEIKSDKLLSKQFVQLALDKEDDIILIPRVGNHEIILGSATDVREKFKKLNAFYEEGIGQSNWNIYKSIDLSFAGQVVCKKR